MAAGDFTGYIFGFLLLAAFIGLPILLTGWNIYFLIKPYEKLTEKKRGLRYLSYFVTPLFGELCQAIWGSVFAGISSKGWNEALIVGGSENEDYHRLTSSGYDWWVYIVLLTSFLAVLFMNGRYGKYKAPIASVLLIGSAAAANVLSLFYCLQLLTNVYEEPNILLMYLLPANWVIITWRTLADEFSSQVRFMKEDGEPVGFNAFMLRLFSSFGGKLGVVFTSIVPVAAVIFIIQILLGQGADAFAKTFTDTADWTFSQQTPPPPEYYEGHYLCTVAAGGHRRLVKPTRFGVRRGERIIVNRQLCVANAFEDLIAERTPRFHKAVRGFYDKHGYPICRFITTPFRADIAYIIMKPLEWVFLFTLYLFDTEPEKRIARQYTVKESINEQFG